MNVIHSAVKQNVNSNGSDDLNELTSFEQLKDIDERLEEMQSLHPPFQPNNHTVAEGLLSLRSNLGEMRRLVATEVKKLKGDF